MLKYNSACRYTALIWIVAIVLFVCAEVILFYMQIEEGRHGLLSLYFWFFPLVIAGPTASGITLYRQIAHSAVEDSDKVSLAVFSYYASNLVLVANATIATCFLALLMRFR